MLSDTYFLILVIGLGITALLYIILRLSNNRIERNTEKISKRIKPFEVIIQRDKEKIVLLEQLEEGDVLSRPVLDHNNRIIYEAGFVITNKIRKELKQRSINMVYIDLTKTFKKTV